MKNTEASLIPKAGTVDWNALRSLGLPDEIPFQKTAWITLRQLEQPHEIPWNSAAAGRPYSLVGESKSVRYTGRIMAIAAAIAAAARKLSNTQLKKLVEWGEVAADILKEREATTRAMAEPRPVAPLAALEWPTAKWKNAPEKILGKKRGIITFLKREWEPFIQTTGKVVTRDILTLHDREAEQALTRHLETHEFPEGISIIYPDRLMRIVAERPELLQAMFSSPSASGMR